MILIFGKNQIYFCNVGNMYSLKIEIIFCVCAVKAMPEIFHRLIEQDMTTLLFRKITYNFVL